MRDHFKVASLDGFGLKDRTAAIGAAGAVLHYLTQHLRRDVKHLTRLSFYRRNDYLALDYTTLRHLEILEPLHHDAPRNASLYGVINRTVTPMGARMLRNWLSQPLAAVEPIRRRQEAVQTFIGNSAGLDNFRAQLSQVRDLERTLGRLSSGSGNARDLVALRLALEQIPAVKGILQSVAQASGLCSDNLQISEDKTGQRPVLLLGDLESQLTESPDLVELISRAIVDEPPLAVKEGGMIRDGFDAALDELHDATRGGKDWIAKLQQQEIERTGIASLKVRFNSVFGYYIEVTKSNLDKVPPHYIRKQTVANGERYITPELKEMEGKILGAEERSVKLEYELFQRVREEVLGQLSKIQQTAAALAQLDVLASFAETARLHSYCRPVVADEGVLQIRDGRHPVLEQNLADERFVPNDAGLCGTGFQPVNVEGDDRRGRSDATLPQIALITGPNMAGKSTYIRQVALITLLAHTGSFVPAVEARIDLVDRIFTRIGASDDLTRGQSHLHGGNDRDRKHPEQRHAAQPHRARRNRARHEHLRRPEPGVEHRRAPAQSGRRENAFCHPLPRADRTGATPAAIEKFQCGRARVARPDCVPAQNRRRRHGQELRHPRRAAGGCAQGSTGAREGDSRQPRRIRAYAGRNGAPVPAPPAGPRQTQATRPAAADGFVWVISFYSLCSEVKNRSQRGNQWLFRSSDSTTLVARPTMRWRSTGPQ